MIKITCIYIVLLRSSVLTLRWPARPGCTVRGSLSGSDACHTNGQNHVPRKPVSPRRVGFLLQANRKPRNGEFWKRDLEVWGAGKMTSSAPYTIDDVIVEAQDRVGWAAFNQFEIRKLLKSNKHPFKTQYTYFTPSNWLAYVFVIKIFHGYYFVLKIVSSRWRHLCTVTSHSLFLLYYV